MASKVALTHHERNDAGRERREERGAARRRKQVFRNFPEYNLFAAALCCSLLVSLKGRLFHA